MDLLKPCQLSFNPRSRVGSDFYSLCHFTLSFSFNPRSRVGSDVSALHERLDIRVSIHAPAWGATMVSAQSTDHYRVSIHAPAWGATKLDSDMSQNDQFQSTLPRGERRCRSCICC